MQYGAGRWNPASSGSSGSPTGCLGLSASDWAGTQLLRQCWDDTIGRMPTEVFMGGDSYYEILGVPEGADANEIKAAFRRVSQRVHPDQGGSDSLFRQVHDAYDTLRDPDRRAAYDRSIRQTPDARAPGRVGSSGSEKPDEGGTAGPPQSEPRPESAARSRQTHVRPSSATLFGTHPVLAWARSGSPSWRWPPFRTVSMSAFLEA